MRWHIREKNIQRMNPIHLNLREREKMAMGPSQLQLTAQRAKLWGKKFTSLKTKQNKNSNKTELRAVFNSRRRGAITSERPWRASMTPYVCKHLNTGIEESSIALNGWTVCFHNLAVCFTEENNSTSNNFQRLTKQIVD